MTNRKNYGTGTEWEGVVGYSRAVRVGNMVYIAGTTATNANGELVGVGDAYAQAKQALANIKTALTRAGGAVEDVVRTRIYVVDIDRDWEAIGLAHGEMFGTVRPVTALVQVARLINPDMLVEIEAEAIITDPLR